MKTRLPIINNYLLMRKRYLKALKEATFSNYFEKVDIEKNRLEKYVFLKDIYLSRLINWYGIPLFLILFMIAAVFLLRAKSTTNISADISASSLTFAVAKDYHFANTDINSKNVSTGPITYNGETSDNEGRIHNTKNNLVKPLNGSNIELSELFIPANSMVKIYKPRPLDLNIVIKNDSSNKEVSGGFSFSNASLITDTVIRYLTDTCLTEHPPYSIQFFKNFADNINFNLSIAKSLSFEMNRIYISNISSFNDNNATYEKPISSILSGSIRLLDTNNDSIVLKLGDSLKINFSEKPVRISINTDQNSIHLAFEGEVDQLNAGAEILSSSSMLNKMPLRIKTFYDKEPYVWAILIAVVPLFITFFVRQRRAL